jgi:hypothetical protein
MTRSRRAASSRSGRGGTYLSTCLHDGNQNLVAAVSSVTVPM